MTNINTATSNIPVPDSSVSRHYKCRQLIRKTAWQQAQNEIPKKFDETQQKRNEEAVIMLSLVAAAYKFCDELISELEDAGLYRHAIKREANKVEPMLKRASHGAMAILKRVNNGKVNTGYYDCMDQFYEAIDNCVSLDPPERCYNILLAICRIVGKYSNKLTEYKHLQSHEAVKVVKILEQIPIHDYQIDNIIDIAVRPIVFDVKY